MSISSKNLILSIDFGSTHAYARIYSTQLDVLAEVNCPSTTIDPEICWQILCDLMSNVLIAADVSPSAVSCFGVSVQRNSFLFWDSQTSVPVTKLSTWQDSRAAEFTEHVNNSHIIRGVKSGAGALYKIFPSAKLKVVSNFGLVNILVSSRLAHVFRENPELSRRCRCGELRFGCLDTWFLWKLTGGKAWCADVSCSSAWGTFDPCIMRLNRYILKYLKISSKVFPPICPTSTNYGGIRCGPLARTNEELAEGVPMVRITGLIGDSQAAMLGAGCLKKGDAKLSLGTGAFFNVNVGDKAVGPNLGFYPVIGWVKSSRMLEAQDSCEEDPDTNLKDAIHLIEGFNNDAGSTVTKIMKMGIFQEYFDLEQMLNEISSDPKYNSVFFVPSCIGLRNNVGRKEAKVVKNEGPESILFFANTNTTLTEGGIFVGLPKYSSDAAAMDRLPRYLRAAIVFAVFDSIAMAARLQCSIGLNSNFTSKISVLHVNGNLTRSNWLMQRLADTFGVCVERSPISEICCMGAAIAAGVGAGIWEDYDEAIMISNKQKRLAAQPSTAQPEQLQCMFSPNQKATNEQSRRYKKWMLTCQKILSSGETFPYTNDANGCFSPEKPISLNGLNKCLH